MQKNKDKIEKVLQNISPDENFINLHQVLSFVSINSQIHISTIRKNKNYYGMCLQKFKNIVSKQYGKEMKDIETIMENYESLKLENAKLKNQIKALSNAIKNINSQV